MRLRRRHFLCADDVAADAVIGVDHLLEAAIALRALHELVGQQDGEGFVADDLARDPYGVAQAQRLLLAGEAGRAGGRQIGVVRVVSCAGVIRPPTLDHFSISMRNSARATAAVAPH